MTKSGLRVNTILRRLGNGLPMESKVFRPIKMVLFRVSFLKCLRSFGKRHGKSLSTPITRLLEKATMWLNNFGRDIYILWMIKINLLKIDISFGLCYNFFNCNTSSQLY